MYEAADWGPSLLFLVVLCFTLLMSLLVWTGLQVVDWAVAASGSAPGVIWVEALVVASMLWIALTATIVRLIWRDWTGK